MLSRPNQLLVAGRLNGGTGSYCSSFSGRGLALEWSSPATIHGTSKGSDRSRNCDQQEQML